MRLGVKSINLWFMLSYSKFFFAFSNSQPRILLCSKEFESEGDQIHDKDQCPFSDSTLTEMFSAERLLQI